MEETRLFSDFPPVTTEEWERTIEKDLKGAEYDKRLVWQTREGFNVKPYYREEDLEGLDYLESIPESVILARGNRAEANYWSICQEIRGVNSEQINKNALDAVVNGADALSFDMGSITSEDGLRAALSGLNLEETGIYFRNVSNPLTSLSMLINVLESMHVELSKVKGGFDYSPYNYALDNGRYRESEEREAELMCEAVRMQKKQLLGFKILVADGGRVANAGASSVQELGCAIAAATDMLATLTDRGIATDDAANAMMLNFAVGSTYFMEIAKFRAARLLWNTLIEQFEPRAAGARKVFIGASTTKWNSTCLDAYVNLLRTTTETMSAVVGGVDCLTTLPFDNASVGDSQFSAHLARNQQIILREESHFDKVADPSAGSYYIENLTDMLAKHAWDWLKDIEYKGGYRKAIKCGFVQESVRQLALERRKAITLRRATLLGINKYPNLAEPLPSSMGADCSQPTEKGEFERLDYTRAAVPFEQLRVETSQMASRPKVFLLTVGDAVMRKARADFAAGFFGTAGYEIINNVGFTSVEDGVNGAIKCKADIVVICSSDDEYPSVVAQAMPLLRSLDSIVVLAGNPKEKQAEYEAEGVHTFIHIKSDMLSILREINSRMAR